MSDEMFHWYFDHPIAVCDKDYRLLKKRAAIYGDEPEEVLHRLIGVYDALLADDPTGIPSAHL